MTVFDKLNLKNHTEILVLNAPQSFESELNSLQAVTVHRSLGKAKTISFALAFVTSQKEVDRLAESFANKAMGDAIVWFAYPKKTSKKYQCDIHRDAGWEAMGQAGFEGVRMVAIDEDWSALRFRRVEFVKNMTRNESLALSPAGKRRAKKS